MGNKMFVCLFVSPQKNVVRCKQLLLSIILPLKKIDLVLRVLLENNIKKIFAEHYSDLKSGS